LVEILAKAEALEHAKVAIAKMALAKETKHDRKEGEILPEKCPRRKQRLLSIAK
jgi:hypothetical protein